MGQQGQGYLVSVLASVQEKKKKGYWLLYIVSKGMKGGAEFSNVSNK